ncbi:hypothetical protein N0V90_002725 [Kalmusia sp. IMI 367209]|nr:hypothetical protein N0V90_002725 [Kalmusia sp. IMI 367209]
MSSPFRNSPAQEKPAKGITKYKRNQARQKEPDSEGGGGGGGSGGGLGGLLGGLVGSAKKAAKSVTGAGEKALDLAKNTPGPGLGTVRGVQNLGRQASNWLTSTTSLVNGFDGLSEDVRDQVKKNIGEFAGEGGPLGKAGAALKAFEDFPLDSEMPQSQTPTATGEPTNSAIDQPSGTHTSMDTASQQSSQDLTATQATSTTHQSSSRTSTSSSSATLSGTPSTAQYIIISKNGTPVQTFKDFTQQLDAGTGQLWTWEITAKQMYLTNLTNEQAINLPDTHSFIKFVDICGLIDEAYDGSVEEFHALNRTDRFGLAQDETPIHDHAKYHDGNESMLFKRSLSLDENAPWWKKMISARPRDLTLPNSDPSHDPEYISDNSGGRGTTIYILDDGFDLTASDLSSDGRIVDPVFAPNDLTLPNIDHERRFEEGIGSGEHGGEHGTM